MTDYAKQDAKNARLEWLLSERVGTESPPDLQHAVLTRLQESATIAPRPRRSRLLAAAMALVGIGAVVAVSQMSGDTLKPGNSDWALAAQQDPVPTYIYRDDPKLVRSRADIEALPKDTREVFGINLDDGALPALLRLQKLESLAMTVSTFVGIYDNRIKPFRGVQGNRTKPKDKDVYITDAALARLAALPSLRTLALEGQHKLKGPGIARVCMSTPLRDLKLAGMAISNDMLRLVCKAPLVSLQLNWSQTFNGDGVKAIASCQTLRQVSLIGCSHLQDFWIANLSGMKNLEVLDLSTIGNHAIFSAMPRGLLPAEEPGSGVTDRLLKKLERLPKLRELHLNGGLITDNGLLEVSKFPNLRELHLGRLHDITAIGIDSLPRKINKLSLIGHGYVDAQMIDALLARPRLRELSLALCRGMPDDAVDLICQAKHLLSLNMGGWNLTEAETERLEKLPFKVKR